MKTTFLTAIAIAAFAANSVLCRLALEQNLIDAAGFTSIRLLAGALTLLALLFWHTRKAFNLGVLRPSKASFIGSCLLFVYAWFFSMAYLALDTGSGALILFGFVQLTLLLSSWFFERRPTLGELAGMVLAFSGLVYWLIPAWGTPSLLGFMMMAVAGVAWGFYTLVGRSADFPLRLTAVNFLYCMPLVLLLNLASFQPQLWSKSGVVLAIFSGAVTSGVGYAIWYAVLPKLTSIKAAVLQLLVPILAAIGGWVFAAEPISYRLLISTLLVLGGVFWVISSSQQEN